MFYNPNNYGNYWRDIKLTKIGGLWTICKCRYPMKQKLIGQSATEEITLIAKYSTCWDSPGLFGISPSINPES